MEIRNSGAVAVPERDREILRQLGRRLAGVLADDADREARVEMWRRNNDRDPVRPMVWIAEVPWHEFTPQYDELVCRCENPILRNIEARLRYSLFQWDHFRVDMILNDHIPCPKVWHSTGFGFSVKEETLTQHAAGGIVSHHYHHQINGPEDIEKFALPEVTYDQAATAQRLALLEEVFDGILPVRVQGIKHIWFTPWDVLVTLMDMTGMMMDLIDRPEFINALVHRYVDVKLHELDQVEQLGLLDEGLDNIRVGSGAYAYTSELPAPGYDPARVRCKDIWGCGNAQIFAEISPDFHWEFSLQHELRWLQRWGLTYYGCCEQLHGKISILSRIPNLRKISMSPRCNIPAARENGVDQYVMSVKPNPAVVAGDHWGEDLARKQIRKILAETEGGCTEIILKDISTVREDPRRLEDWARVAMEEVGG